MMRNYREAIAWRRALLPLDIERFDCPGKDIATKNADSLITPNLIDFLPLSEGMSIVEMKPPSECVGKTLAQIRIRNRFGLQVAAVRTSEIDGISTDSVVIPDANFRIEQDHVLVIMGENKNIEKFQKPD